MELDGCSAPADGEFAPAMERGRGPSLLPSLPDSMTLMASYRPTIFPTWCRPTTTAPTPAVLP